jgi:excisionase family DNA binding protein
MLQKSAEVVSRRRGLYAPEECEPQSSGGTAVRRRLLNVSQAAQYLGRTPKSIRHLVQRRKLRCIRADGRVMFDVSDLDAWIDMNRV